MKRLLFILLLASVSLPVMSQDVIKRCAIKIGNCKVYEKENSFDAIMLLKKGQEVDVLDIVPTAGRYMVRVKNTVGYIADQYIYDPELIAIAKERAARKAEADNLLTEQIREENWKKLVDEFGYEQAKLIKSKQIRIGMSARAVRESWGDPSDINTTTTAHGTHEQWVYRGDNYNDRYAYFDNGVLTTIQE